MGFALAILRAARPHPEERVFARLEGWMAPAGPHGSRRRCAPPHHEGL